MAKMSLTKAMHFNLHLHSSGPLFTVNQDGKNTNTNTAPAKIRPTPKPTSPTSKPTFASASDYGCSASELQWIGWQVENGKAKSVAAAAQQLGCRAA
jgi:hypothetical protein